MSDLTPTWTKLLRELDLMAIRRDREKLEAMTQEEREAWFEQKLLGSLVNMP